MSPRTESYTYGSWEAMRQRTTNPNCPDYPSYGGRGITCCARWASFDNFLEDMGDRPVGLTLERECNDRGYTKDNCRWATPKEQAHNRTTTVLLAHQDVTQSKSQWARSVGLHPAVFSMRINAG